MMIGIFKNVFEWVQDDWKSNPFRFCVELISWFMSIGANIMFAMTVPNVPFILYLSITVTGCAMYAWSAWSRRSFGMLANYLLLTFIDSYGLIKVLTNN